MNSPQDILGLAAQRATAKSMPYTGELTPREAFEVLQQDPATVLVDVRSKAELELVGKVPGATNIEWAFYPGMVQNTEFVTQILAQVDKNITELSKEKKANREKLLADLKANSVYQKLITKQLITEQEMKQLQ